MDQQWLKETIGKGVAMLLVLRLKNTPPEDAVKATLESWFRVITYKRRWSAEADRVRFEEAFMRLAQTCEWFPTPAQLLNALPAPQFKELPPPPPPSDEQINRISAQMQQLLKKMKRGTHAH